MSFESAGPLMNMKMKINTSMRWRELKGNLYVDVRDMQLLLRSVECTSENAETAFKMLAEALRDFENEVLKK